jgi:hypothetical protein
MLLHSTAGTIHTEWRVQTPQLLVSLEIAQMYLAAGRWKTITHCPSLLEALLISFLLPLNHIHIELVFDHHLEFLSSSSSSTVIQHIIT